MMYVFSSLGIEGHKQDCKAHAPLAPILLSCWRIMPGKLCVCGDGSDYLFNQAVLTYTHIAEGWICLHSLTRVYI